MKPTATLALLLGLAGSAAWLPGGASEQNSDLVRVLYLAEVTNYCSLIDNEVSRGYRRERDRLIERDGLTAADFERARTLAWKMGYAEWQNRGLGGFRNWCRTEGAEAAEFFRAIAKSPVSDP